MVNFIKFTKRIINVSQITDIIIREKSYDIYLTNNDLKGFIFLSSGWMDTHHNKFTICQTQNPQDYDIMRDWVNKIK